MQTNTEQSSSQPHEFTILINNQEFLTPAHLLSGNQIKQLAGIPLDYELFEVRGHETVPVTGGEEVHIHDKAEFRAIPAGTFGKR